MTRVGGDDASSACGPLISAEVQAVSPKVADIATVDIDVGECADSMALRLFP
jgi:hypothetical protein